jgi:2-dehydro-3-deoxyglucarate aldolase
MDHGNALRGALESGEAVLGARATTLAPPVVDVYGDLGLDFVWIDLEHSGPSPADSVALGHLVRAADAADTELLVRLPSGEPELVRKALDAGVRTLLIPRVETAAEVRRAVRAAHFSYDGAPGGRGVAAERTSDWGASMDGYTEREDDAVLVGAMVETATAVENIEDLLSVPELGFAFAGPADLSVSLGHPLEPDHPDVADALATLREACLDAGVPLGRIANDPAEATRAVEEGYQLLRIGDELGTARRVLGERLDELR